MSVKHWCILSSGGGVELEENILEIRVLTLKDRSKQKVWVTMHYNYALNLDRHRPMMAMNFCIYFELLCYYCLPCFPTLSIFHKEIEGKCFRNEAVSATSNLF